MSCLLQPRQGVQVQAARRLGLSRGGDTEAPHTWHHMCVCVFCVPQVGRAGRFGTKGLAISFVSSQEDTNVLNDVQARFDVDIKPLPAKIDASTYMNTN